MLLAGQGKEKFELFKQRPPQFSQKEQVRRLKLENHHRLNYSIKTTSSENTRTGSILIENIYQTICE
jgi:hypothetical protein